MKKLKKFLKVTCFTFVVAFTSMMIFSAGFFYYSTKGTALDTTKLEQSSNNDKLRIFDSNNSPLKTSLSNSIKLNKLSSHTKNAFICAEDKRFYKHNGLDYIRIAGATISNLKTKSFSEGASTISQQLIKNTQLSNEKTIKRKLKEMKLTKKLEHKYSKEKILELYLNSIYFGNGCYGVENASNHYFNKSASKLSVAESAMLAGSINAPSVYDIENHTDKAIERRNLILKLMKNYNKITEDEYKTAINEPVNLSITNQSSNSYACNEIIKEACKILNTSENILKNKNLKIYTKYNQNLAKDISSNICKNFEKVQKNYKIGVIVIENNTNKIISSFGTTNTLNTNKQPGSTIKPVLVYAPAIEKGIVSPTTKLLDEKINIIGYSPENADKKYHGYVSVRESLKNSYNIPAVKLLNEVGISNAQNFAKNLGINFDKKDNNLAIALGGFTNGVTLKTLCDAYSCFACNGNFKTSSFISKITDENNNCLYEDKSQKTKVMNASTAYLITDILKDCSTSGTAKRLKNIPFEVASKTGTVGKYNSNLNTDAFNICYTSEHTILTYIGGENMPESINGATYPTLINKNILELIYSNHKPSNFIIPDSVEKINIDRLNDDKNFPTKIDSSQTISEYFAKNNLPKFSTETKIDILNFENKKPVICFYADSDFNYYLKRKNKTKEETIFSLAGNFENQNVKFCDAHADSNQIYEYYLEFTDKSNSGFKKSNSIKLKTF